MTIRELREILSDASFDEDAEVIVFCEDNCTVYDLDVDEIYDNNGNLQFNIR